MRKMTDGSDILTFGRDPDRPSWWETHRRLGAAAAAIGVACALVTVGVLTSHTKPSSAARPLQPMATMLTGMPFLASGRLNPLLLGGPAGVRLLRLSGRMPGTAGLAPDPVISSSVLGPSATVEEIAPVSGGVVALLSDDPHAGVPATGYALFIPVTTHGAGVPRVIAEASYLAVAPNQREIWVEQLTAPSGRNGRVWLVSESGRRLSGVLRLHSQTLLAATVGGLLVQGPSGEGALLSDPLSGVLTTAGIPSDALVVAVGTDDVAWLAASCARACSLHITSLRDDTDTVIPLPPGMLPGADSPSPAAFDLAGQRLALAMEITNREDRITGTSVYVASLDSRRLNRLPGEPIPPSAVPARLGAVPAGSPDVVSVHWAGSGLWIVATNGEESQAAYWSGAGALRVLAPISGAAYTFSPSG
jgi:hypothetical protein